MIVERKLLRELDRPLSLAIGFFDGLHRGHRALIERARRLRRPGWRCGVLTFENHPTAFLHPGAEPPAICTTDERLRLLAESGVETCFIVPFDGAMAALTPEEFMRDVLIDRLGVRAVVVGTTFRFGHKRVGDAQTMAEYFARHDVAFVAVANVTDDVERISSTRIRLLIADGEMTRAGALLGGSYEIRGVVERGAGRGHGLGFPTANVRPPQKLLPKDGVYAAIARFDGRDYAALLSIGTNPTFGEGARTVEAWLRDFHRTIYGCELTLRELRFVREQHAFDSADELRDQMQRDLAAVAYPAYA